MMYWRRHTLLSCIAIHALRLGRGESILVARLRVLRTVFDRCRRLLSIARECPKSAACKEAHGRAAGLAQGDDVVRLVSDVNQ